MKTFKFLFFFLILSLISPVFAQEDKCYNFLLERQIHIGHMLNALKNESLTEAGRVMVVQHANQEIQNIESECSFAEEVKILTLKEMSWFTGVVLCGYFDLSYHDQSCYDTLIDWDILSIQTELREYKGDLFDNERYTMEYPFLP